MLTRLGLVFIALRKMAVCNAVLPFSAPDGNWVTWGSSDGGRLTVVDLKALESGANELFQ